jgi:hypothetical protein
VAALEGNFSPRGRPGLIRNEDARPTLAKLSGDFSAVMRLVQGADMTPTVQAMAAFDITSKALSELFTRWIDLKTKELKSVNEKLRQANIPTIVLEMELSK